MKQASYASSDCEGSDEPAHPRKVASALTAEGCEIEISKAGHLGNRFIHHTSVDVCTPTLVHAKISLRTAQSYQHLLVLEQNIKHFVGPDLGPNCLLKFSLPQPLWGGGGGGWVRHC